MKLNVFEQETLKFIDTTPGEWDYAWSIGVAAGLEEGSVIAAFKSLADKGIVETRKSGGYYMARLTEKGRKVL